MTAGGGSARIPGEAGADGGSRVWEASAACGERDADLWFSRSSWSTAVAICAACPVLEPCLAAVLQREKGLPRCRRQGVVAGLTGPQRHDLERPANLSRAQQRRPAQRPGEPADRAVPRAPAVSPRTLPAPCGTRAAYQRHLRRGEPVDEACRAANAREAGRYRRTGSTRDRREKAGPRDLDRRSGSAGDQLAKARPRDLDRRSGSARDQLAKARPRDLDRRSGSARDQLEKAGPLDPDRRTGSCP
ncbi:WhiB family transcriptional regulator [Streptomyces sp. Tu102]|uniref:WhiB family transcriptional regulator n=1 Tax=Streptomyces sp. Tu102 TaxID=2838019 RepID=UPI001BDD5090|nr:WhiB family transcriptional regulator [Streptomyces sp. Tu102]MBT1097813.1 WhiB family transcriptional regulator [Streptomyces sp. Tu102]